MAIGSASILLASPFPICGLARLLVVRELVLHDGRLFRIDEGDGNRKDRHDDCNRKPRILGLNPRAERDHDDGKIGRDGDEHCTDRLRLYFEFHSMMGETPLACKLISLLRRS